MTALLTDNLPLLAGTPNGIKKLRELILELSVRGKLVPQDSSDEPASELLKRIAEEKARLVADGKIKKQKPSPEIGEEEKSFQLPAGWEWVRLGSLSQVKGGKRLPAGTTFAPAKTPHVYIQVTNMKGGTIIDENLKYIDEVTRAAIKQYTISKDDVYITIAGTIGDVGIVPEHFDGMNLTENAAKIVFQKIDRRWLQKALSSQFAQRQFSDSTNQLAQPKLALHRIADSVLALPPLTEQNRIVAKVDELMALCDRLEAQKADAESAHAQLVQALLDSLTQATEATEFAANWQRLAEHFHTLFTTEPSIDALKQNLLQLAVMGKLVPQDPSDEPASELLKRIIEEKASSGSGGRSRKQTDLPDIDDSEKAFKLPGGWEWVRLQQIISVSSGDGLVSANMKADGGVPVYGGNGVTGYHDEKNVDNETLVIGRVGYYCGSIHLTPANAWVTDNALIASFSEKNIYKKFLFWLLKGTNLKEQENATAQPVISGRKIYPIVLAIPPLAEQQRIVAKVDQLMALCDQLKTRITQARQLNEQLASTLVEQAVA